MRIAVLGAGAMGSLYGGLLQQSGNDVVLIDVLQAHINAVNESGLNIESHEGTLNVKVRMVLAQDMVNAPELILLFTKTIYSKAALDSVKHILGEETWILSLQNGLGNETLIRDYVPTERILIGTTDFPSDFVVPGRVWSNGRGTTKIMSADGRMSEQLRRVARTLDEAGLNCIITQDVFVSIWEKVAFNSAMNAITAVTRLRLGDVAAVLEGKELAFTIAREVISVANRKGVKASEERVLALMENDFREHMHHMPSMLQDILAKRTTEVCFINGAVVQEAESLGVSVSATKALYQLIITIQANYPNLLV